MNKLYLCVAWLPFVVSQGAYAQDLDLPPLPAVPAVPGMESGTDEPTLDLPPLPDETAGNSEIDALFAEDDSGSADDLGLPPLGDESAGNALPELTLPEEEDETGYFDSMFSLDEPKPVDETAVSTSKDSEQTEGKQDATAPKEPVLEPIKKAPKKQASTKKNYPLKTDAPRSYKTAVPSPITLRPVNHKENRHLPRVYQYSEYNHLFFMAIQRGDLDAMRAFLRKGVDLETRNEYGETPLAFAVRMGREPAVRILLMRGANVNSRNAAGDQPLHVAVRNGRDDLVRVLAHKGANTDALDAQGQTALALASSTRQQRAMMVLSELGGTYDIGKDSGTTALHVASWRGDSEVLRRLLIDGANVHALDQHGRTPLHVAAQAGRLGVVQQLINAGALETARDPNGHNALDYARASGRADVVQFLMTRDLQRQIYAQPRQMNPSPVRHAPGNGSLGVVRSAS